MACIGVDGLAMAPMASMAPGFIGLTVRGHPLASPVVCGNGAMQYVTLVRTPDPHFDWIDQRECPRFRFPCPPYAGDAPSKRRYRSTASTEATGRRMPERAPGDVAQTEVSHRGREQRRTQMAARKQRQWHRMPDVDVLVGPDVCEDAR